MIINDLANVGQYKYLKMSNPKEILNKAVKDYLENDLMAEGFKYYDKSTKFKKKNSIGFIYEINFLGSKTNWLNEFVNFNVQYLIHYSRYKSWHKKAFPTQAVLGGGNLQGNRHIPFERTKDNQHGFGYDFVKFAPQAIMNEIWTNYLNHGKRYFDSGSTWDAVHEHSTTANLKVDSLIFQNKFGEAHKYVKSTIEKYIESYASEEEVPLNSKQNYQIFKSRLNYLELEYGL